MDGEGGGGGERPSIIVSIPLVAFGNGMFASRPDKPDPYAAEGQDEDFVRRPGFTPAQSFWILFANAERARSANALLAEGAAGRRRLHLRLSRRIVPGVCAAGACR